MHAFVSSTGESFLDSKSADASAMVKSVGSVFIVHTFAEKTDAGSADTSRGVFSRVASDFSFG